MSSSNPNANQGGVTNEAGEQGPTRAYRDLADTSDPSPSECDAECECHTYCTIRAGGHEDRGRDDFYWRQSNEGLTESVTSGWNTDEEGWEE